MAELVVTDLCPKMKIYSVANVLSADEAQQLIEAGEARGFKDSSPSGGGHGRTGREDARTSQFSVLVDQDKLAQLLWDRLKPSVPPDCTHLSASGYLPHEQNRRSWAPVGVNPRLRLYKYDRGQCFPEHIDYKMRREVWRGGAKHEQMTFLSVVVYLNQDFAGGQTGFWTSHDAPGKKEHCRFLRDCEAKPHDLVVTPATGMACCMDQNLLHEGLPVTAGVKYVLRTDFVHERALPAPHPKLAGRGGGGGNASPPPDGASEWERLFETSCKNYAD